MKTCCQATSPYRTEKLKLARLLQNQLHVMMHDVTQKHHDDSGQKHDRRDCLEDNEGRAKESVAETATEGGW